MAGTAAYMAPEQARGRPVDKRAGIWSWGVVFYELVTGDRLFAAEDIPGTLARVLTHEPNLDKAPPQARKLLSRCLEKDPKKRLRDIADASDLLETTPPSPSPARRWPWALAGALLATALTASLAISLPQRKKNLKPLLRLEVDLGPDVWLGSTRGPDVILSPDGSRMMYVSKSKLFTRRLDQEHAVELAGTEGAFAPFFSPDSQWIGYFTLGKLSKISVEGTAPVLLAPGLQGIGGSWGDDGNIIAVLPTGFGTLSRIPSRTSSTS